MDWATFWATFPQTHLVTLMLRQSLPRLLFHHYLFKIAAFLSEIFMITFQKMCHKNLGGAASV
jgi:hypothetical protein